MPEGEGEITATQFHEELARAHDLRAKKDPAATQAWDNVHRLAGQANRQMAEQMSKDLKTTAGHPSQKTVVDAAVRKASFFDRLLKKR